MSHNPDFLPYGRHALDEDDVQSVVDVLRGDWLSSGPAVTNFEAALVERVGASHAVSCSSGTAGLHLACLAIGFDPGDVAIVPALTFMATANAVRLAGGEVWFADVDPDTGLMTQESLQHALNRAAGRVRAVLPVHMNGQTPDMGQLKRVIADRETAVIEDAAHALGAITGISEGEAGAPVGACRNSHMTVFSFHPVKPITTAEGGAVVTNDDGLAGRVREFRSHGIIRDPARMKNSSLAFDSDGTPNPWYYEMHELGLNYRSTDVQCALGISQLDKLDKYTAIRRQLAGTYDHELQALGPHVRPVPRMKGCRSAWHLYVVHIDFATLGTSRARVMNALRERGIGSQVHYIPVHLLPFYVQRYGRIDLPGAQSYYDRALSIPLHPRMTDVDVRRVVSVLADVLGIGA